MFHHKISKNGTFAAGTIAIMMLVILLFSTFYIAAEADHHCTGKNCPICTCIQQCESTLRQLRSGAVTLVSVTALLLFFLPAPALITEELPRTSLITKKVRLNN